ncbi:MAG: hypothetical protein WD872_05305 [Pirellulaceae bacterium]
MKRSFSFVVFFATLAIGQTVAGAGLEMTIRAHPRRVIFGDPLYLEVTIVNRGEEVVTGPKPIPDLNTIGFPIYDPQTRLTINASSGGGGVGFPSDVSYQPGQAVKHYWHIYLPKLTQVDNKFWKPMRDGGGVVLYAQHGIAPGLLLRSNLVNVGIGKRKKSEMLLLEHYAQNEVLGFEGGPSPANLGVSFKSPLNLKDTRTIGANLRAGELQDMLFTMVSFQEVFEAAPADQPERIRILVNNLKKQPDIKRQWLTQELHRLAKTFRMAAATEALQKLIDEEAKQAE